MKWSTWLLLVYTAGGAVCNWCLKNTVHRQYDASISPATVQLLSFFLPPILLSLPVPVTVLLILLLLADSISDNNTNSHTHAHTHIHTPILSPCGKLQLAWRSSHSSWLIDSDSWAADVMSYGCLRTSNVVTLTHTHIHVHIHICIIIYLQGPYICIIYSLIFN